MNEVRDAATVIVLRGPPFQVLLLRRHARSGFMAGAYVFPGGKLDERDRQEAAQWPGLLPLASRLLPTPGRALSPEVAAGLHLTAVRETEEECGLRLDPLGLTYFSHWITPSFEPRRFDTRFFVAAAPQGQEARADEKEITDLRWLEPTQALLAHDAGEIFLPPPTQVSLRELAPLADWGALRSYLASRPVSPILPKVAAGEGEFTILLPWDPDYAEAPGEGLPATGALPGTSRIAIRPRG